MSERFSNPHPDWHTVVECPFHTGRAPAFLNVSMTREPRNRVEAMSIRALLTLFLDIVCADAAEREDADLQASREELALGGPYGVHRV